MTYFGATILDAETTRLTRAEKRFFAEADPFGFILFARNIDTPDQVRALCDEMRSAVGRDAIITIDQEGGRVQRLGPPHWRAWLPPLDFVAMAGAAAEEALRLRYRVIAQELRALGIDSNCAPLADLALEETHPFLRNRCLGSDPRTVARRARAVAEGHLAGGVVPVIKHIPGHGRATLDSHLDLPEVLTAQADLVATDFAAFMPLTDVPMAMTAHVVYADLDPLPATLSHKVIAVIRQEIGYDGLIMTDDISMKALEGELGALSRQSIEAGCDVVLHCNGTLEERRRVADAAGRMSADAQARAERAMAASRAPEPFDLAAAEARLEVLINGRADV